MMLMLTLRMTQRDDPQRWGMLYCKYLDINNMHAASSSIYTQTRHDLSPRGRTIQPFHWTTQCFTVIEATYFDL